MDERQVGMKPESEYRNARWVKPADRANPLDSPRIVEMKLDFLDYLGAGLDETEAAEAAWPEKNAIQFVNYHRELDPVFDQQVENVLTVQRQEWVPKLESNLLNQALFPSVAGGNLALKVLERMKPDRWGKQAGRELTVKTPKTPEDFGLNPWLADPEPLDASFREMDKPEDE